MLLLTLKSQDYGAGRSLSFSKVETGTVINSYGSATLMHRFKNTSLQIVFLLNFTGTRVLLHDTSGLGTSSGYTGNT